MNFPPNQYAYTGWQGPALASNGWPSNAPNLPTPNSAQNYGFASSIENQSMMPYGNIQFPSANFGFNQSHQTASYSQQQTAEYFTAQNQLGSKHPSSNWPAKSPMKPEQPSNRSGVDLIQARNLKNFQERTTGIFNEYSNSFSERKPGHVTDHRNQAVNKSTDEDLQNTSTGKGVASTRNIYNRCTVCNAMVLEQSWNQHAATHHAFANKDHLALADLIKDPDNGHKLIGKLSCSLCSVEQMSLEEYIEHVQSTNHMTEMFDWISEPVSNGQKKYRQHLPVHFGQFKYFFCEICLTVTKRTEHDLSLHLNGRLHKNHLQSIRESCDWLRRGQMMRNERFEMGNSPYVSEAQRMGDAFDSDVQIKSSPHVRDRSKQQGLLYATASSSSQEINKFMPEMKSLNKDKTAEVNPILTFQKYEEVARRNSNEDYKNRKTVENRFFLSKDMDTDMRYENQSSSHAFGLEKRDLRYEEERNVPFNRKRSRSPLNDQPPYNPQFQQSKGHSQTHNNHMSPQHEKNRKASFQSELLPAGVSSIRFPNASPSISKRSSSPQRHPVSSERSIKQVSPHKRSSFVEHYQEKRDQQKPSLQVGRSQEKMEKRPSQDTVERTSHAKSDLKLPNFLSSERTGKDRPRNEEAGRPVLSSQTEEVARITKRARLSLVHLDDKARDVLAKKIEATWQKYYYKYYSCVDTNPEIVLEMQKEYLRSYKGFFKEDPYFEYYYTKVAKPEDLREALTLRIDRGSPGPNPNEEPSSLILDKSVEAFLSSNPPFFSIKDSSFKPQESGTLIDAKTHSMPDSSTNKSSNKLDKGSLRAGITHTSSAERNRLQGINPENSFKETFPLLSVSKSQYTEPRKFAEQATSFSQKSDGKDLFATKTMPSSEPAVSSLSGILLESLKTTCLPGTNAAAKEDRFKEKEAPIVASTEPMITSTTQGYPREKGMVDIKPKSVMDRLGAKHSGDKGKPGKDEKSSRSRHESDRRSDSSRSRTSERRRSSSRDKKHRKSSRKSRSKSPYHRKSSQSTKRSEPSSNKRTSSLPSAKSSEVGPEIFEDPFLGFLHKTLTGIILISQLQKALANGDDSSSIKQDLMIEQKNMRERMMTSHGHLLIELARCSISDPGSLSKAFPQIDSNVPNIISNLDPQIVTLIAETPILNH